jgi:hypothetical protein
LIEVDSFKRTYIRIEAVRVEKVIFTIITKPHLTCDELLPLKPYKPLALVKKVAEGFPFSRKQFILVLVKPNFGFLENCSFN